MSQQICIAICAILLWVTPAHAGELIESTDSFGPFGTLHMYQANNHPDHLVLLISGDGGWNLGVIDMARTLAALDSMVVGIDITHYIPRLNSARDRCNYSAADFETLSQYLQKKYRFEHYVQPVLVGYSSGATMVYTILAQSPANTFAGGISLSFCPDLKTDKPFCRGSGNLKANQDAQLGFIYHAVDQLPSPWSVLQGNIDQVCPSPAAQSFVTKVAGAEFIDLPRVGHGFSVRHNWGPQFKSTFQRMVSTQAAHATPALHDAEVRDLPLIVMPTAKQSDVMAVIISGDGGWASLDKQIGETLNSKGIAVIGLNALQYFWSKKTPDIAGADMTRILTHYSRKWAINRFLLIGYSRGADTLPFMASRLPAALKMKVVSITLLGMEKTVDFEFHVGDWLSSSSGEYQVIPEVAKLAPVKVICIYGSDESNSGCSKLTGTAKPIEMAGGHHFGGDYKRVADIIMQQSRH
ncbi:virulence factor family protein [Mariprofundus erugo]|uniref:Virulence factor family protein n=1 Tax=Mariprofundus erugo TaxID=2528639 RepID=A0A5R9GR54_9PROT|nr:AcvB/VirJ family lysyl-phosphatidylglycerol hydrolase [Mariprofundus erugo]TLS68711.1 virulence factor family protein [Mariprofundus erugo]